MRNFTRPDGYDQIIKEYFNLDHTETRKVLLNINEADQNQILTSLVSKLYDNIVQKIDDIDFGGIPATKGDITKLENYDKISECIEVIRELLVQYKQPTDSIDIIDEALGNIKSRKDVFEKGFRYNIEFIMVIYSTITLSIISSVSYLISTCVEFIKTPSQDNFQLSLDHVALVKTKQNLLFNNLKRFNSSCTKGDIDRSFDFIIKNGVKELVGTTMGTVAIGVAIVGLILNILPMLRELVFFFYYSRMRISDYFDVQADLLQINAYNLQNAEAPMKKTDKERIVKKQLKIVQLFRTVANKLSIDTKQSEKSASKDISTPINKLKTDEISNEMPDSAASSTSLF